MTQFGSAGLVPNGAQARDILRYANNPTVGGIPVFWPELDRVSTAEMEALDIGPGSLYGNTKALHMLRRFERAAVQEFADSLVGQQFASFGPSGELTSEIRVITREDVEAQLSDAGSKFISGVPGLSSPRELLNLVASEAVVQALCGKLTWFAGKIENAEAKKCYIILNVGNDIGYLNLMLLSDLPVGANLTLEKRDGTVDSFRILVNREVTKPTTSEVTAVIGWLNGASKPILLTAYPGPYIPDFPKYYQTEAERDFNSRWYADRAQLE